MVQYGRSSRYSWKESVRSSFGKTIMEKAILEKTEEIRLGAGFHSGLLTRTPWKKGYSYLCMWMTSNWLERNKTLIRCGKHSIKQLIWENRHLSLIMCTWDVLKDNVKWRRILLTITEPCLNRQFPRVRTEKLPYSENFRISSWSYDMAGHAKKCVERYCELSNKTTQQLYKVSTPCIDDHHFKEEEMKSVGELSHVCSQIVLKCLYLARIGRPDILWSVNKLARSITKWTKACDKRLSCLISDIHHTCEYKLYCYVGLQNNAGWDCFKTPILQEILKTQNPLLEEHYALWKSYICSNQLDV